MSNHADSTPSLSLFDEAAGFRETYLHRFTEPEDRAALLRLATMLFQYWMECGYSMPGIADSGVGDDLQAALSDLRYLARFLRDVIGKAPAVIVCSQGDTRLAGLANTVSVQLDGIAEIVEVALERDAN